MKSWVLIFTLLLGGGADLAAPQLKGQGLSQRVQTASSLPIRQKRASELAPLKALAQDLEDTEESAKGLLSSAFVHGPFCEVVTKAPSISAFLSFSRLRLTLRSPRAPPRLA